MAPANSIRREGWPRGCLGCLPHLGGRSDNASDILGRRAIPWFASGSHWSGNDQEGRRYPGSQFDGNTASWPLNRTFWLAMVDKQQVSQKLNEGPPSDGAHSVLPRAKWSLAAMAGAAFAFTVAAMLISRQIGRAEAGDSAIWDYVAQSIVRGQLPYRDVVEIKLPGAAYLSAIAIWIGELLGVRDLIAIRLLNFGMIASLSAITLLVAELYVASRPVAIISFLIPLISPRFVEWMAEGSQPRLPMILFGMLTLLLIAKDRPLLAGLSSALSCMCWQPGLLFTGVAFLIFSRYLTTWRDFRALKVLAGACLPLAAMFLYFAWRGAAGELWSWSFAYTFSVYAPAGFRGILGNAKHVWNVTSRVLGPGVAFLALALLGYAILWWEILSHPRQASGAPTGRLEASGSRKP